VSVINFVLAAISNLTFVIKLLVSVMLDLTLVSSIDKELINPCNSVILAVYSAFGTASTTT
jgi:hypothetical protein